MNIRVVLLVVIVLGAFCYAGASTSVVAASGGCSGIGITMHGNAYIAPAMNFDAGDVLTYHAVTPAGSTIFLLSIDELSRGTLASIAPNSPAATLSYIIPASGSYELTFGSTIDSEGGMTISVSCSGGGGACFFTDGRVNCRAEDAAQTAAIYCNADGGVTLFAVNNSVGTFAYTATPEEVVAVPLKPAQNTLIKVAQGIALYRLRGGKMQVNAPKGYVYIWDGC